MQWRSRYQQQDTLHCDDMLGGDWPVIKKMTGRPGRDRPSHRPQALVKGVLKGQGAPVPYWPTQTILTKLRPDFF